MISTQGWLAPAYSALAVIFEQYLREREAQPTAVAPQPAPNDFLSAIQVCAGSSITPWA